MIGYLDPASGSAIIGAIAAGGAGMAVAGKAVLSKLRLSRRKPSIPEGSEAGGGPDENTR